MHQLAYVLFDGIDLVIVKQCYQWWKDEILPYKHAIVPYGTAMQASLHKLPMAVGKKSAMPFRHGGAIAAI